MEEFRKPFEYVEEKRGYILLFVIMLVVVDVLQTPLYILPIYRDLKQFPVLCLLFAVIGTLYALSIAITALACYLLNKHMVIISKIYLVVRFVIMAFYIVYLFISDFDEIIQTGTIFTIYLYRLILPVMFELGFSALWFLFFLKSKQCREIVNKRG